MRAPLGRRRVGRPRIPSWLMIAATALWPTTISRPKRSFAVTRCAPQTPPEARWTSVISPARKIRRSILGEVGRLVQA